MVPPQLADLATVLQTQQPSTGEWFAALAVEFLVTAIVTAVLAAIVYVVAPEFTRTGVDYLHREPGDSFIYGLIATILLVIALFLLAITIIGLIVVIPAVIVLAIVGVVANSIGVLALGSFLSSADVEAEFMTVLAVGSVAIAGLQLIPFLGGLFNFIVYTAGFGYIVAWVMDESDLFNGDGRVAGTV